MTADVVGEILDRRQIIDLQATYCERLDEYDLDGVAATFTQDAIADYGPGRGGRVEGRAAIRARIARGQAEFRRTAHVMGQSLVTLDGDRARAVTYITASHERWNGVQETLRLRYIDGLRREPRGWLIAERRLGMMVAEGFEGTDWMWVERRQPEMEAPGEGEGMQQ